MKKILKKLGTFTDIILSYLTMLFKRNKSILIFGAWFGKKFSDNSKYLYLHALRDKSFRPVWITEDESVYKKLRDNKYEVYYKYSLKGILMQIRSKVYFTCTGRADVAYQFMGGAMQVNLWHGLPLKKIMYDDKISAKNIKTGVFSKIKDKLFYIPLKNSMTVSSSPEITRIYKSAFKTAENNLLEMGQPRNDVFYLDFLEDKDFPYRYKTKKVILYMPTHRNEGKTKINITSLFDLKLLNEFCKKSDILFLVKKHFYHGNEPDAMDSFSNIEDITNVDLDAQMLLKYADILITDYSSCYIDYLLLNRPIIFYNYDYENYLLNDRELYFPYTKVTPGAKVTTFDELFKTLTSIINENKDEFYELRNEVKNLFYSKENQNIVGPQILDFVKRGRK